MSWAWPALAITADLMPPRHPRPPTLSSRGARRPHSYQWPVGVGGWGGAVGSKSPPAPTPNPSVSSRPRCHNDVIHTFFMAAWKFYTQQFARANKHFWFDISTLSSVGRCRTFWDEWFTALHCTYKEIQWNPEDLRGKKGKKNVWFMSPWSLLVHKCEALRYNKTNHYTVPNPTSRQWNVLK